MKILGIDTSSTKNFSIGLLDNDKIIETNFLDFGNTDEYITFAIDSIQKMLGLDLKTIDYFTVGIGPGSFTGLRIGVTIIKTLAWAAGKNVIPLSSLELLVYSYEERLSSEKTVFIPVIDSRTGRVFSAILDGKKRVSEDMDIAPEKLVGMINKLCGNYKRAVFLGDGLLKYKEIFDKADFQNKIFLPEANIKGNAICKKAIETLKLKNNTIPPEVLEPNYLRKSEAEIKLGF
ncbi:MAG: tRNA (adenosine(37)-N6)-threonylcarbamoyltransferase complex dimerization subunit type 1 TsaB [Brevinematia bacterium]